MAQSANDFMAVDIHAEQVRPTENHAGPERKSRTWADYWESWFIPSGTDSEETSHRIADPAAEHGGYHPSAVEEETEAQYAKDLEAATSGRVDTSGLEGCGFLSLPCVDRQGSQVVVIIPDRLPAHVGSADAERIYSWCIVQLHGVVQQPYTVVYVHTGAPQWQHRPNMMQLRHFYERLPLSYKRHLKHAFVLHSDLTLRGAMTAVCPFFSHGFWGKVAFITRLEFLFEHIAEKALLASLPSFVRSHERVLEEQPLHDYGYVKTADLPLPGPSGEPI